MHAPGLPCLPTLGNGSEGGEERCHGEKSAAVTPGATRRSGHWVSKGCFSQSGAACEQAEAEAVHLANEMQAEYWSVSAKTGEWGKGLSGGEHRLLCGPSVLWGFLPCLQCWFTTWLCW